MTGDTKNRNAPSEAKSASTTGLSMPSVITSEDLRGWDAERDLAYPGEFPFTRGIYPTMYRGRLWTMRQYAGFGSALESNRRYRYLMAQGQTGLSVAFDLPTQIGMDSDHALALGEVGKVGVAIDSIEDMQALFDGIPLERISTSMTINSTAAILLALYVAVAKQQGANLARLSGTVQNDVLKEYIARGTYIYPLRPAMRIVPTFSRGAAASCRTGMRFRFPGITFARRARRTCRKLRSRSGMRLRMWRRRLRPDCRWMNLRRSFPFSSTRTTNF